MTKTPSYLRLARYHGLDRRRMPVGNALKGIIAAALILILAFLISGCSGTDCSRLEALARTACAAAPNGEACKIAKEALVAKGCQVQPSPSPTVGPTPEPTTSPSVSPTLPPSPPEPTPTPAGSACPARPVPMDKRYIQTKIVRRDADSGKAAKLDSTPRVRDRAYCGRATGDQSISDCKANPEGSGYRGCDAEFLGAACPIWQQSVDGKTWFRCDPRDGAITCDHLDDWNEQTPYIGPCEKNAAGSPISGFAMVVHGQGWARACTPDLSVCSKAEEVDH